VLQAAVDAMEKDPAVKETLENRLGRKPGSIVSRMHYFYSRDFAAKEDKAKVIEQLDKGIKADPTDADVLIAMYRAEAPNDEWRAGVIRRIEAASGHFRDQMEEYDRQVAQAPSESVRNYAERQLASACNQYAWLVGNTMGDFDEALRASKRSLEIRTNTGGYLDTLGRCYFAKGDLENAIKSQQKAVDLDPHSQQIRRQLDMFKRELAKTKKAENE
jgi:tetratricopeptide (TPR) repeat protein